MITYEEFQKLDIRIGTVISAEPLPGADKLYVLKIDVGEDAPRQIVAGIRGYIPDPQTLFGKQIPLVANLEPRTIRGAKSDGMILATSHEDRFALLHPAEEMPSGSIVR